MFYEICVNEKGVQYSSLQLNSVLSIAKMHRKLVSCNSTDKSCQLQQSLSIAQCIQNLSITLLYTKLAVVSCITILLVAKMAYAGGERVKEKSYAPFLGNEYSFRIHFPYSDVHPPICDFILKPFWEKFVYVFTRDCRMLAKFFNSLVALRG